MQRITKRRLTSTYHISFSVNEEFDKLIRHTSAKIQNEYKSKFAVDGKSYIPHMSMYLFAAPIVNQKEIIAQLNVIAEGIKLPTLSVNELFLSDDGWLMVYFDNAIDMRKIHKLIINKINPLRMGVLRKKYRSNKSILKLNKNDRLNLLKYGDRHVLKDFYPHMSLTKFDNMENAEEALKRYSKLFNKTVVKIVSLDLIRGIGSGSGAIGKVVYRYNFNN